MGVDGQSRVVGIVGYGTMGGGMGRALRAAGFDVVAYDPSEAAQSAATSDGARIAASPREAGERSIVTLVSLPGPAYVEEALLDDSSGLIAGMGAGSVLIDTTTTSLEMVQRVSAVCAEHQIGHLDAPVSGRPPTMSMLIGGSTALIEQHRDVLGAIASELFMLGDTGAGTTAKLMNQYVSFASYLLLCEAATISERAGLTADGLTRALSKSSAASGMLDLFRHVFVDQDLPFTPGSVALIAKDMRLVRECIATMNLNESPAMAWAFDVFSRGREDEHISDRPFPEILDVIARDLIHDAEGQP